MQTLESHYRAAAERYKKKVCRPADLLPLALHAVTLLSSQKTTALGQCDGKAYASFQGNSRLSRPFLPGVYISSPQAFQVAWRAMFASARPGQSRYTAAPAQLNAVLYTTMTAVCCCYDLWKHTSRKTPGTIFEIVLGTVIHNILPGHTRSGHVILPGQTENVSTDIVFERTGKRGGIVIPAKITTRERVVQPFAHQRILDSVFGAGVYRSLLLCVSEMQLDRKNSRANAICVPGTIRLFSSHLAKVGGLFYLDPPARYLKRDVTGVVTVKTIGDLLGGDLSGYL